MNNEITNSMNDLNKKIANLLEVFKVADDEMKRGNSVSLDLLNMKLDKLVSQHDKIADAIIALTEMVQGNKKIIPPPIQMPPQLPNIPPPMQVKPSLPETSGLPIPQIQPDNGLPTMPELPPVSDISISPKPGQLRPLSLSGGRQTLKPLGKPPRRP
ncbi:MAG: hypothetical protein KAQ83_00905 [Nanoarchaeota archaeon]|nr:hypothetical protein [Nanoarchaeota archaeon]